MTNTDKALLLAEWSCPFGACPVCCASSVHKADCAMNLALSERGYCTSEERVRARELLAAPPVHSGSTTIHVLFEGRPLCGFMAGTLPSGWPDWHKWVSIADVGLSATFSANELPCDRCFHLASSSALTRSLA